MLIHSDMPRLVDYVYTVYSHSKLRQHATSRHEIQYTIRPHTVPVKTDVCLAAAC